MRNKKNLTITVKTEEESDSCSDRVQSEANSEVKSEVKSEVSKNENTPSESEANDVDTDTDTYTDNATPKGKRGAKRKSQSVKKEESPAKRAKRDAEHETPGEWTADKREAFMDRVIEAGYKAIDRRALAAELGLTLNQVNNQLQRGRKGLFRDKAVRHIRGDDK